MRIISPQCWGSRPDILILLQNTLQFSRPNLKHLQRYQQLSFRLRWLVNHYQCLQ